MNEGGKYQKLTKNDFIIFVARYITEHIVRKKNHLMIVHVVIETNPK